MNAWIEPHDVPELARGAAAPAREGARPSLVVGLVACLAMGLHLTMALSTHLTEPAALMTVRYAENIAHGNGFVYNLGERVLGTTTPLFALLVALGIKLGAPGLAVAKALGVLAVGALTLVMDAWLRAAGRREASLLAAVVIALDPQMIHWSIAGMETSLVVLFGASAWLAFTRKRDAATYALLGVLFLIRWDTVLLTATITAAILVRDRRLPARGLALFALVVAPWVIFATLYFGSPIPVTVWAKAAVNARNAVHLHAILPLFVDTRWEEVLTAGTVLGLAVVAVERQKVFWPAIAWYTVYWAAYLVSRMPPSHRYALPPLPVGVALASVGATALVGRLPPRWSRVAKPALAGAVLIAVLAPLRSLQRSLRAHQDLEEHREATLAVWLAENTDPADRIMVGPASSVGYFGYFSRRTMIDTKGTVTPVVIPYWGRAHLSPTYDIATALRPEWCVLRPADLREVEQGAAAASRPWEDDYARVTTLPPELQNVYAVYHRRPVPGA